MKINDRVDLGNEIDSLIVAHCNSHQCCMEDNKSDIVNDILDLKSPPFDWIRVKDKLPEDDLSVWVLIYSTAFGVECCARNSAVWINSDPTHWMPLPRPPKRFRIKQRRGL
jgi:hypothetical protein